MIGRMARQLIKIAAHDADYKVEPLAEAAVHTNARRPRFPQPPAWMSCGAEGPLQLGVTAIMQFDEAAPSSPAYDPSDRLLRNNRPGARFLLRLGTSAATGCR